MSSSFIDDVRWPTVCTVSPDELIPSSIIGSDNLGNELLYISSGLRVHSTGNSLV